MQSCHYHEKQLASWFCPACNIHYCSTCIPGGEDNFGFLGPQCYSCGGHLQYVTDGENRASIWSGLWRFFVFPLVPGFLVCIYVMIGLLGIASLFEPIYAVSVMFIVLAVFVKFGHTSLEKVSLGKRQAPGFIEAFKGGKNLLFLQFLIFLLIGLVAWFAEYYFGFIATTAWLYLASIFLPASILVLISTSSIGPSINPFFLLRLISELKLDYYLLLLCYLMVIAVPFTVYGLLPETGNYVVIYILLFLASFYFNIVSHAMIGYMLFCHGSRLGLKEYRSLGINLKQNEYRRRIALSQSYCLMQDNHLARASEVINQALLEFPEDMGLHERKHQQLLHGHNPSNLAQHCASYCELLIKKNNPGKAAVVYLDCVAAAGQVLIFDDKTSYQLAELMLSANKPKLAIDLLKQNTASISNNSNLYMKKRLLMAKILAEGLDEPAAAKQVVRELIQEGFDGPEVQEYLEKW